MRKWRRAEELDVLLLLAKIPGFYDVALRLVDILFVLNLLDADAHTVLGENDVLLAHTLRRCLAHLGDAQVNMVEDKADTANDAESDDQGEDLPKKRRHLVSQLFVCTVRRLFSRRCRFRRGVAEFRRWCDVAKEVCCG